MASTTRDPTAVLSQSTATSVGTSSNSPFAKPAASSPRSQHLHPQLAHLANAGLTAANHTLPAFSTKHNMSPRFQPLPLTGAAAMADNLRHEKEMAEQRAGSMMSANPARTALMGLQGNPLSRVNDAPRPVLVTKQPSSMVVEPMDMDKPRAGTPTVQSPVDISMPDQPLPPSAVEPPNVNSRKRPASPRVEERSIKAMTYPPPLGAEEDSPRSRNMSYPGPGQKSPSSAKKHKCPHCSTEFTRHHNLKSHLLTHSQEKPYGCEQCSSRFRRLHDLKRHIKLHTGERSHACGKCGRRFARGDALARHNKGPGGCAGRRGSGGEGDDYNDDTEMDPSMEGGSYHADGQDLEEGDNHFAVDERRRRSEPHSRDTVGPVGESVGGSASGSYHQHSSTYPGIAPMSRSFYPPPPTQGSPDLPHDPPRPSPTSKPSSSAVHFGLPQTYSQGSISESPAPLSPGQQEIHRSNNNTSLPSQFQPPRDGRPGTSLPPPLMSQQQSSLPSMNVFAGEQRYVSSPSGGAMSASSSSIYPPPHSTASSSIPSGGSASSNTHGSGGSMREILRGGQQGPSLPAPQPQDGMWEYMKNYERQLEERITLRLKDQQAQYEAEISRLKDQITSLTGQQQRPALPHPQAQ